MGQEINSKYSHIATSVKEDKDRLLKQITNIEIRQQELQNFLSSSEQGVQHLENIVGHELQQAQPNHDRIKGCRVAISKHIELIAQLHRAYKDYEDIKFRYHKEINDINQFKIKMIDLDLRRLDEKLDNGNDSGFADMLQVLMDANKQTHNNSVSGIPEHIVTEDDPNYQL